MLSKTIVPTAHAHKYLQQLCKHWQHKLDVTSDANTARIGFHNDIVCNLVATDTDLQIALANPHNDDVAVMEEVVVDHLVRFAFREVLTFEWNREELS